LPRDSFGREIDYLRISLTDHCNLRCVYCMPMHGLQFVPPDHLLTAAEIETVGRAALAAGFRRFRLTGGEPTLRTDVVEIVERLAALGPDEVAMTTNGVLLPRLARPLAAAGLRRVNIHVDTLDPVRLPQVMRLGTLADVEAGLEAAVEAGLVPLKINCVVVRGFNDGDDAVVLARRARARGWHVRFIEAMPLGTGETAELSRTRLVPSRDTRRRLEEALGPLVPLEGGHPSDESRNFRFADGAPGVVGFISPVSEPYCGTCNRMRLTADGKFHLCLLRDDERDVRGLLRSGGGVADVERILRRAVAAKPMGHQLLAGLSTEAREMFQIGG
jgi:cyclic pyranopterin phosphate synthase